LPTKSSLPRIQELFNFVNPIPLKEAGGRRQEAGGRRQEAGGRAVFSRASGYPIKCIDPPAEAAAPLLRGQKTAKN